MIEFKFIWLSCSDNIWFLVLLIDIRFVLVLLILILVCGSD